MPLKDPSGWICIFFLKATHTNLCTKWREVLREGGLCNRGWCFYCGHVYLHSHPSCATQTFSASAVSLKNFLTCPFTVQTPLSCIIMLFFLPLFLSFHYLAFLREAPRSEATGHVAHLRCPMFRGYWDRALNTCRQLEYIWLTCG